MTEEEIIRYCKALIEDMKMHHDVDSEIYIHENDYEAIEGLLDLLETEKHYAKVYENMVKDYEKICIEKNKRIEELEEEIDQMNKDKWEGWLEENE